MRPKSKERGGGGADRRSVDRDNDKENKQAKQQAASPERGGGVAGPNKDARSRRSRSGSSKRRRKERSVTPRATRVYVGKLSRNVVKDHIVEIFGTYGEIRTIDFPIDRFQPFNRGFCYIDFANPDGAEGAIKNMDGGQVDGQEISVSAILIQKTRPPMRRPSPIMRNNRPPPRWRSSPRRYQRRSPIRRNSPRRRRSRSPAARRRRHSNSSDSSR